MDFHRNLMQKREDIGKLQVRKGLNTAISAIAGSYMKYISYTVKDGKITIGGKKQRNNRRREQDGKVHAGLQWRL